MASRDIDLQHSFVKLAEMGEIKSYRKAQYCWKRDISELSSEHIFSRQFLEISSDSLDYSARRRLAQHWESQQLTPETHRLYADRISISQPNRRLRIGYLSADWRNHPVGRFMLPILKHLIKNLNFGVLTVQPIMTGSVANSNRSRTLGQYQKSKWITEPKNCDEQLDVLMARRIYRALTS